MHEVKLPQLGQSVEEASIVEWYKQEGDSVQEGEPLFSVQTDKAEIECEATASGVLRKQLAAPDDLVPVMTVVALIGEPGEPLPDLAQYAAAPSPPSTPQPAASPAKSASAPAPAQASPATQTLTAHPAASPRASATAARLGIPLTLVQGTGAANRIVEADVLAHAHSMQTQTATPSAPAKATMPMPPGETVPLTPMRRIVAERMTQSKFNAPHFYVTVEANMTAAKTFRESQPGDPPDPPSYNDLILAATVAAIKRFPAVNAGWGGDHIVQFNDIHLGFAVALPAGLVVPVIRNAQSKSFAELAQSARNLVEKAKNNKLNPDDYTGATFTVSNLGAYGVDHFTAIINPPGSAILAVGRMQDRPAAVDGKLAVQPSIKLTLSSDHRVIDGAVAAQFTAELKAVLENAAFEE